MKLLVVCKGNLCRSPMAEGYLLSKGILCDSAGTHAFYAGKNPDERAIKACDYDISTCIVTRVNPQDFIIYDYILAMDSLNEVDLILEGCPQDKIVTLNIADPYKKDQQAFYDCYTEIKEKIDNFLLSCEK